jgi:hypothetical protein
MKEIHSFLVHPDHKDALMALSVLDFVQEHLKTKVN